MNLEQQLNVLDTLEGRVEAEPLIDRCFEIGFFPFDNPKFLVFLHHTILVNIAIPRGNFMRGLIYARHVEAIAPDDVDSDILKNIKDWANLRLTEGMLSPPQCSFPHVFDERLFWVRFWRRVEHEAWQPMDLRLKLAKLRRCA